MTLLTQDAFGAFKTPRIQKQLERGTRQLGVEIVTQARVTAITSTAVMVDGEEVLAYDVCVWAGGFTALPLAREAGLTVNERGQIMIDPFMRSLSHPDVYAAGDSAWPVENTGAPVRMSVFAALVMGAHTADCLANIAHHKALQPLSFSYYGQAIALGRHAAVGFMTYPDDVAIGPLYTGWIGFQFRGFFVGFTAYTLILERLFPGFFFWMGKRRVKNVAYHLSTHIEHSRSS